MAERALPIDLATKLAELRQRRELVPAELLQARQVDQLATGIGGLDALLGGGIPLGRITQLATSVERAGGALAVAQALVERVTSSGGMAAWIEVHRGVDALGLHHAGVDLERMLYAQAPSWRPALQAADTLLSDAGVRLVVVDLGPCAARDRARRDRPPDAAWIRLSRRAEGSKVPLLLLGPEDIGASHFAAATLRPVGFEPRFEGVGPGRTFEGALVTMELLRNKLGRAPGRAQLQLAAPPMFPREPGGVPEPLPPPSPTFRGVPGASAPALNLEALNGKVTPPPWLK